MVVDCVSGRCNNVPFDACHILKEVNWCVAIESGSKINFSKSVPVWPLEQQFDIVSDLILTQCLRTFSHF